MIGLHCVPESCGTRILDHIRMQDLMQSQLFGSYVITLNSRGSSNYPISKLSCPQITLSELGDLINLVIFYLKCFVKIILFYELKEQILE